MPSTQATQLMPISDQSHARSDRQIRMHRALNCHGFSLRRDLALSLHPLSVTHIRISCGRAWLTRTGDLTDYFLVAGEVLTFNPGDDWVVETLGGELRFELDAVTGPPLVLTRFGAVFAFAVRKAASMANRAQGRMKWRASIASTGGVT